MLNFPKIISSQLIMEWKLIFPIFLPSRNTIGPSIQDNVGGGVIVQKTGCLPCRQLIQIQFLAPRTVP